MDNNFKKTHPISLEMKMGQGRCEAESKSMLLSSSFFKKGKRKEVFFLVWGVGGTEGEQRKRARKVFEWVLGR